MEKVDSHYPIAIISSTDRIDNVRMMDGKHGWKSEIFYVSFESVSLPSHALQVHPIEEGELSFILLK